jgi:8-oxo-dGTP diphosphatase
MWALPGGFVEMDESLEAAARRELFEETGIKASKLEQVHIFGDPGRDPRGRTISVVYLAFVNINKVKPRAGDDAAEAGWHFLRHPPALAFDHRQILSLIRQRLKKKLPKS